MNRHAPQATLNEKFATSPPMVWPASPIGRWPSLLAPAIIADIKDCSLRGQPVLVGTTSIEASELLSGLLDKEKLSHHSPLKTPYS